MTIQYTLESNTLGNAVSPFRARVVAGKTIELDDLIEGIIQNAGTTVSRSDIAAVFADFKAVTKAFLFTGHRVNLNGLCRFSPSVKGGFTGMDDGYDPLRHKVSVACSADGEIRKEIGLLSNVEKIVTQIVQPKIFSFVDTDTETTNMQMTTGNIGSAIGHLMTFDKTQLDEGLFVVDSVDNAETVRVSSYNVIKPKLISFLIPNTPLTSGEGFLELRTRMSKPAGEIYTFTMGDLLTQV